MRSAVSGKPQVEPEPVCLGDVVEEVAEELFSAWPLWTRFRFRWSMFRFRIALWWA